MSSSLVICKLQLNLPQLRICSVDLGEVSIKMSSPTLFLQSFLRLTAQCRRQRSTKSGTKFQSFLVGHHGQDSLQQIFQPNIWKFARRSNIGSQDQVHSGVLRVDLHRPTNGGRGTLKGRMKITRMPPTKCPLFHAVTRCQSKKRRMPSSIGCFLPCEQGAWWLRFYWQHPGANSAKLRPQVENFGSVFAKSLPS